MAESTYIGNELELFEKAHHWKKYFKSHMAPYLKGDVLEVGAGLGGTTALLCDGTQRSWECLEPDEELAKKVRERIAKRELPPICTISTLYSSQLPAEKKYDAILYVDVIEHIEADGEELKIAASHLKRDGVLIILVPAHQFLFSPFDERIGHYRRYSKSSLRKVIPDGLKCLTLKYLDSVGLLASLGNKMLLQKGTPTSAQIRFWDSKLVPVSTVFDKITNYTIGKTVMGIWQNDGRY